VRTKEGGQGSVVEGLSTVVLSTMSDCEDFLAEVASQPLNPTKPKLMVGARCFRRPVWKTTGRDMPLFKGSFESGQ